MPLAQRIAFVGAGSMTEALVSGLLHAGLTRRDDLIVSDILRARREHFQTRYQIQATGKNREAARQAQILVVAVEPQDLDEVLDDLRSSVPGDCLVISVAAGYPLARLAAHLGPAQRIVRAMPNTPSTVLAGATALAFPPQLPEADQESATAVFQAVGRVVFVEESLMDAVTGVSGSGPAYVYLMIEALADGGVRMGLPRSTAELLAAQTVLGAAKMLLESGEPPGRLKDRVASPGGTTIAGLARLEDGRVRGTLISAVEAAVRRSKELGSS
ncbi:pyrroline-5-carboxylate reductase [Candidatus Nitrospira bockiana]